MLTLVVGTFSPPTRVCTGMDAAALPVAAGIGGRGCRGITRLVPAGREAAGLSERRGADTSFFTDMPTSAVTPLILLACPDASTAVGNPFIASNTMTNRALKTG